MRDELVRASANHIERLSVLLRLTIAAQCELRLGQDARERGAQLVRELGGEETLVPQAGRHPVEEPVERGRELRQLVVGRTEGEALVEVALAPLRGLPRHLDDGPERGRDEPADEDRNDEQHENPEDDRRDQGRAAGRLVR